jgi:hypothetical protein
LSLAKLTALASGSPSEQVESVLARLDHAASVVIAQEQLPKTVLEAHGFDAKKMRVMSPRELIEVRIVYSKLKNSEFSVVCRSTICFTDLDEASEILSKFSLPKSMKDTVDVDL